MTCPTCNDTGQIMSLIDGKEIGLIACPDCQWPKRPEVEHDAT